MPSLSSNKNKWHLPPFPPTEERRCITVAVPDDPQWVALFYGAIYRLSQQVWYDRDTGHTAKDVAAVWQEIYIQTLNNENDCSMPSTCCPIRYNPFTGRLQQSDDEGLTWFDVADGPWEESLYPEFSGNTPPPRTETNKECAAALTAAYVLRRLYEDTCTTLLEEVAGTDWDYAGALGAMIQGFLYIIGAAAAQPYVAISVILGIVGVKEQFCDYPLTDADEENIACILRDNASVSASGSVTFDFQAVWDAIDIDSPKNGLVRLLLTLIGPDALNYAGAVDFDLGDVCSFCDETCLTLDFRASNQSFGAVATANGNGLYVSGEGWTAPFYVGANIRQLYVGKVFASSYTATRIEIDYDWILGATTDEIVKDIYLHTAASGSTLSITLPATQGTNLTYGLDINKTFDRMRLFFVPGNAPGGGGSDPGGSVVIHEIRFYCG